MEQLANFLAASTLNMPGDLDAVVTSIIMTSLTDFPSAYPYRIRIGDELLKVTALASALTLTVGRADGGTTAAIHSNGSPVVVVLTKESLDAIVTIQLAGTEVASRRVLNFLGGTIVDDPSNNRINISGGGGNIITYDTASNRPTVGSIGNVFFANDYSNLEIDNASAWVPYGPLFRLTKPPVASTWTQISFGGTDTLTDSHNTVFMHTIVGTRGNPYGDYRFVVKSKPTPPYTVTIGLLASFPIVNYSCICLLARDSSSGKFISLGPESNSGYFLIVSKMNNPTSNSSNPFVEPFGFIGSVLWLRISDDNTNMTYSISADGLNFMSVFQEARTTFLPGGGDQLGWGVDNSNGYDFGVTLISWLEGP